MSVRVKIEGIKAVKQGVKQLPTLTKKVVSQELAVAVDDMEAEAKAGAPVDLGFHRNNIRGEANGMNAELRADALYAPYLEFGTGASVQVPKGLESYALKFKGAGIREVNLPARPHFFPAVRRNVPKMMNRIRKRIKIGK